MLKLIKKMNKFGKSINQQDTNDFFFFKNKFQPAVKHDKLIAYIAIN